MRLILLTEEQRNNATIVYLDIDINVRRSRLQERNDNNDDIERRLASDERDFSAFVDFDIQITDPEFNNAELLDLIYKNKD